MDLKVSPVRIANMKRLRLDGFQPAAWLPEISSEKGEGVRPREEIAARLMALDACFTWVVFTDEDVPSKRLQNYIERGNLSAAMSESEQEIFTSARDQTDRYRDHIGWKLENMWSLAWVLGFEPEPYPAVRPIDDEVSKAMILEFLPGLEAGPADLLKHPPRPEEEVLAMEDLFFCAHNAVRAAENGEDSVPQGFETTSMGGVIHERRHSLTWCISPNVSWDETDLST